MAFVVKDRVKVSSTTTGTGTLTLGVAPSGFQDFSVIGNGNTTSYAIVDNNTGAWEVGIGTYTASGTLLSRDTVLESSTGGAKVSFAAGAKDVFVTYPAETSVTDLGVSRPTIRPSLLLDFANTEALDPRITFARASTARYYNGVTTAKAEENLLLQSQDFTTTWTIANVSRTANTDAAPDGTTTADVIVASASTNFHRLDQSVSATGTVTLSVFAKAGVGSKFLTIGFSRATTHYASATFDLTAGTNTQTLIAGYAGSATATITASSSGYYRCSVTATSDTLSNVSIGISDTSTFANANRGFDSYLGDGTSSLILWGAQVEQRSAVTAYTPTTTQPITNYVPVLLSAANNVARFDHSPTTGESLGLLIEEQRTNLLLRSEEFDNAAWTKTNATITANTVVAPDGTLTGDKLVEDTANGTHGCNQNVSVTSGTTYTLSTYAKAGERTILRLASGSSLGTKVAFVDLSNGAITSESGTGTASVSLIGNGWYRIALTVTATATTSDGLFYRLVQSGTTFSYTGNGFSGIFIWGAQHEAGAFPTSYIPTVASQVTRSADAASMTGANFSSWFRADEGTLFSAFTNNSATGNRFVVNISDSTATNRISTFNNGVPALIWMQVVRNNAEQAAFFQSGTPAPVVGAVQRVAGTYRVNDFDAALNGATGGTDISGLLPVVSQLEIGSLNTSDQFLNGHIRKLAYYPKRLTNAEIVSLTS